MLITIVIGCDTSHELFISKQQETNLCDQPVSIGVNQFQYILHKLNILFS